VAMTGEEKKKILADMNRSSDDTDYGEGLPSPNDRGVMDEIFGEQKYFMKTAKGRNF
jgi:hypothetical protein